MIGTTVVLPSASVKDLRRGPIRPIPRIIPKRETVALLLEWQSALFWGGLFCASPQATQKPSSLSPSPLISRQEAVWPLAGQAYFCWEDGPCPALLLARSQTQNFLFA